MRSWGCGPVRRGGRWWGMGAYWGAPDRQWSQEPGRPQTWATGGPCWGIWVCGEHARAWGDSGTCPQHPHWAAIGSYCAGDRGALGGDSMLLPLKMSDGALFLLGEKAAFCQLLMPPACPRMRAKPGIWWGQIGPSCPCPSLPPSSLHHLCSPNPSPPPPSHTHLHFCSPITTLRERSQRSLDKVHPPQPQGADTSLSVTASVWGWPSQGEG